MGAGSTLGHWKQTSANFLVLSGTVFYSRILDHVCRKQFHDVKRERERERERESLLGTTLPCHGLQGVSRNW